MNNEITTVGLMTSFLSKGGMSEAELDYMESETAKQHYKSGFNFLNVHNGWRPGKIHTFIAPTHSGKSTLVRSMVWDFLVMNDDPFLRVFVWLSEETAEEFKQEMARLRLPEQIMNRLIIGSEMDLDERLTLTEKKIFFARAVEFANPDLLIFDNVTTSVFYADRKVDEQGSFANYLKKVAIENEIPIGVIAHTGGDKQLNKRLLELNDIRGGKAIVNITHFAYILQRIRVVDPMTKEEYYFPTIKIEKHRGYVLKELLFKLRFEALTVHFSMDKAIPWSEFKEAWKQQVSL